MTEPSARKKIFGHSGSAITARAYRRIKRDTGLLVRGIVDPPKIIAANDVPGGRYSQVYDASAVHLIRPANFTNAEWKVFSSTSESEIPASRVFEFSNGYIFGDESWVFDHRGYAIGGMWDKMGGVGGISHARNMMKFGPVTDDMRSKARRLTGKTVLLNNMFGDNYYHFVNQIVTKVPLFKGFFDIAQADHIVVPPKLTGFMREWLGYAGVDLSNAVPMEPEGFACDHIIMASNPSPFAMMQKWACEYLRDIVPVQDSPIASERIFVSRIDALPWRRQLTNREEITALAQSSGFEIVAMDGRSVAEQAAIWRNAKIVLAVHGAAQCNQIFCEPGTDIIELLPRNHVEPCFSAMSQSLKLNHHILMGVEKPLPLARARRDVNAHVTIDPEELRRLIGRIEAGSQAQA